ncbi:MAG: HAD-IIIC family phosphatase [Gemmatimonadaceae bacterium]
MNFLEAHKLVSGFAGGPPLPFLLAMSGTPDKLDLFLRAAAAKHGRSAAVRTLPFNTLAQALLAEPAAGEVEVFVLFPWDLVPEADWRSGVPASASEGAIRERAQATLDRLARRRGARFLYVPAPIPPLFPEPATGASLEAWLGSAARSLGAHLLPAGSFSLASYLANGSAFAGTMLGEVAEAIVARALAAAAEPCKVLVTDLDNVMWGGVIGEDGLDGIHYGPEGVGYRFFLYQSLLAKLKHEGVLLAAVSRNDEELALGPFRGGRMTLGESDFVSVIASYNAKSAQIAELAARLNLGLDSFAFVDDNPIELAEVSAQLPAVKCVRFPHTDDGLPALFAEISALFARPVVTGEDRERTEMYRRRLEGMVPSDVQGADLTSFLRDLEMTLTLHDRSQGDRTRVVQLINKTNQFNLNGRRVTDDEVGAVLAAGGRLYGASMGDRSGSHGEVLACLVDGRGVVRSLVMSCRVFQRRVEHAFFAWLSAQSAPPSTLDYTETPRNEPIRQWMRDPAFSPADGGLVHFDAGRYLEEHGSALELFAVQEPSHAA